MRRCMQAGKRGVAQRGAAQRGYALLTVLGLLLLLAVVAARLDARVDLFRSTQGAWLRWAQAQQTLHEAREQVLLALGTTPRSAFGFGPGPGPQTLRVDGRVYRLPSGALVSVQDARGLISVSVLNAQVLYNFLVRQGVPDAQVPLLLDALADYGDLDDLRRINGAEREDYQALGLPGPRNDWPVSVYELAQVASWQQWPQVWQRAGDFFTVSREEQINPNTAAREVLLALPGATAQGVDALLAQREGVQLASAAQVAAISGVVLGQQHDTFHPGMFYRLRLWLPEDGPGALEYNLMFTPNAPRLPWQVLEARVVDRPALPSGLTVDALPPFPLAPGASAAADGADPVGTDVGAFAAQAAD